MTRRSAYRPAPALAAHFHSSGASCRICVFCSSRAHCSSLCAILLRFLREKSRRLGHCDFPCFAKLRICAFRGRALFVIAGRGVILAPIYPLSSWGGRRRYVTRARHFLSLSSLSAIFPPGGEGLYSLLGRRQDRTRKAKTRHDKTRQGKQDKTEQGKTRHDKERQDMTGQGNTGQDRTRKDRTRRDKTKQDKTKQDKTRHDKPKLANTGQGKT